MDINQAARMIEWLDEERRRDKQTIAILQERLSQQQDAIDTLLKRINSIESDQSVLRTQTLPAGRDAEIMETLRREMHQLIESIEAKRLTAEREAERRMEIARENMMRPVRDMLDKLGSLERRTTELPAISVEKDRLGASISSMQQRLDDLHKRFEEPDRRLAFLEEQRRADSRRIGELESELPELRKIIDGIKPKITLLEDIALRNERRIQELQTAERDRRDQIQQFIDQQNLLLQQRDQQVAEILKRFGEQDSQMQRNIERFETWSEAYREMKRIIDDFERLGERIERRTNEVAEMQRLSEERFRAEWNDWRGDDQRRWKQFTLSTDEVWRQHDKEFEHYVGLINEMLAKFPPIQDAIDRLWSLERERAQLYRDRYQALLMTYDTHPTSLSAASSPAVNRSDSGNGLKNGTP
jgi:chromosome segregation ATPase